MVDILLATLIAFRRCAEYCHDQWVANAWLATSHESLS